VGIVGLSDNFKSQDREVLAQEPSTPDDLMRHQCMHQINDISRGLRWKAIASSTDEPTPQKIIASDLLMDTVKV
jgi:hypothetical protein